MAGTRRPMIIMPIFQNYQGCQVFSMVLPSTQACARLQQQGNLRRRDYRVSPRLCNQQEESHQVSQEGSGDGASANYRTKWESEIRSYRRNC